MTVWPLVTYYRTRPASASLERRRWDLWCDEEAVFSDPLLQLSLLPLLFFHSNPSTAAVRAFRTLHQELMHPAILSNQSCTGSSAHYAVLLFTLRMPYTVPGIGLACGCLSSSRAVNTFHSRANCPSFCFTD